MTAPAPATVDGVLPPPTTPVATAATTVAAAEPAPAPLPRAMMQVLYVGVGWSPCGRWTAHVLDPADKRPVRVIGAFPDEHAAALAHDRVAVAFHGERAHLNLNFKHAFHRIEFKYLLLMRARGRHDEVCAMVADGTYEARYASFLRKVFALEQYGEFLDVMLEFFIARAAQIGEEALVAGGEKLADRFVAMHGNKALDPAWRDSYHHELARCFAEMQRRQKFSMEQNAEGQQQQQQQ